MHMVIEYSIYRCSEYPPRIIITNNCTIYDMITRITIVYSTLISCGKIIDNAQMPSDMQSASKFGAV